MKIYISGPISGQEEIAKNRFLIVQKLLEKIGVEVINPFDLDHSKSKTWEDYMRVDIKALCDCDAIYMLKGWNKSRGAKVEWLVADFLKLQIIFEQ